VRGMIVDSVESFGEAIASLDRDRVNLRNMAQAASKDIRERFSLEKTILGLDTHYEYIMKEEKKAFNFSSVFGSSPDKWFLSCIGKYGKYFSADLGSGLRQERLRHHVLYEQSKSSVFQFFKYYPQDKALERWANMLGDDLRYPPKQGMN
jgi:L-malate glycosyltransferase